jgi:predicted Fe-Mo cluster-binding NifX family protein
MDSNQQYDAFRVAFASSDGYVVDTHFGRATSFYIYQYFEGEYVFVEERNVTPVCLGGSHSTEKMKENVAQFSDCQYIVALRIGMGAMAIIQDKGITPMALPGDITDAMEKLRQYNEIQNLFA